MMSSKKSLVSAVVVSAFAFGFAGTAAAEDEGMDKVKALMSLNAQSESVMTLKEAMQLVLKDRPGTILKAEIEEEDEPAKVTYEIDIVGNDGDFYEYEVNPSDGAIIDFHQGLSEKVDSLLSAASLKEVQHIDPSAFTASLNKIDGQLLSLEREDEDGNIFYTAHSLTDGEMTQQLLNVNTGEVVFFRHHKDHDHE